MNKCGLCRFNPGLLQWLGAPSCLRGSFAFYKSVGYKAESGTPHLVWKLGEFYFVRCGPKEPVCIAEVTLLWEDQKQRHLLASSRLYFLPEDTPKGRTREHGEDEVLAVSKRIVIRVEDLVKWTCLDANGLSKPPEVVEISGQTQDTNEGVAPSGTQSVKVLSYPQYCRFRSLQKRVQEQAGCPGQQDPHLMALGGIRVAQKNTRVLYCRDTFNHPTLDNNTSVLTQIGCSSVSLKGRPRKRRGRDDKGLELQAGHKSESWIDRMKENVMGSVEMHWESGWLPHPEEQLFLDHLYRFMERRGSPISKVPNLGFKKIDLFLMYSAVKRLGGYESVTAQRLWKTVYNELGGSPGSTSAATCTRRHYEKLMLPYEQHLNGGTQKPPMSPVPNSDHKPVASTPKPSKGKSREAIQRRKQDGPATPASSPEGHVVRRGRGRPPGKRKSMTKTSPCSNQGARTPQGLSDPPLSVFQELHLSNRQQAQGLILTPSHLPQIKPDREVKLEHTDLEILSPVLSAGGGGGGGGAVCGANSTLGGFSPTIGLCPLDVFRSYCGFNGTMDGHGLSPTNSTPVISHQSSELLQKARMGSPESSITPATVKEHQCSGCTPAEVRVVQRGRSRSPLPPLRIIPLDLDCSLQVRQLMRTRLGEAHMQSFTKRLSEALSQDLGKGRTAIGQHFLPLPPPPPAISASAVAAYQAEQALPLNLSTRNSPQKPASPADAAAPPRDDSEQPLTKRPKLEFGALTDSLGSFPILQDQPADLSSPCRVRALLKRNSPEAATEEPRAAPDACINTNGGAQER
ncbi:AT-rich interactive domain-containing protein 5B isoform X2 [Denticeps clupeoides]|uniref:AT-rich interactive domain-containing protein 5B isoform X2 n=1 Tax=Denticeps clupeoides TaxID=299321 RepID=UPI0010A4C518|nr:AT-rich interactive domain-containing protein 5B-like isoform X2 [Denticeps clupeoides]